MHPCIILCVWLCDSESFNTCASVHAVGISRYRRSGMTAEELVNIIKAGCRPVCIMRGSDTPLGLLWDGEAGRKRPKRNRRGEKRGEESLAAFLKQHPWGWRLPLDGRQRSQSEFQWSALGDKPHINTHKKGMKRQKGAGSLPPWKDWKRQMRSRERKERITWRGFFFILSEDDKAWRTYFNLLILERVNLCCLHLMQPLFYSVAQDVRRATDNFANSC